MDDFVSQDDFSLIELMLKLSFKTLMVNQNVKLDSNYVLQAPAAVLGSSSL